MDDERPINIVTPIQLCWNLCYQSGYRQRSQLMLGVQSLEEAVGGTGAG